MCKSVAYLNYTDLHEKCDELNLMASMTQLQESNGACAALFWQKMENSFKNGAFAQVHPVDMKKELILFQM